MDDTAIKHLEFIQNIINRMANNSFLLKGWNVTVSSAILMLIVNDPKPLYMIIALFFSISLWGLDAYYLRQERLFRILYDDVRVRATMKKIRKNDVLGLDVDQYQAKVPGWFRTLWSGSLFWLHGMVVFIVVATIVVFLVYLQR